MNIKIICLLGYDAMQSGRQVQMLQKNFTVTSTMGMEAEGSYIRD
jgi:hypothetical protein